MKRICFLVFALIACGTAPIRAEDPPQTQAIFSVRNEVLPSTTLAVADPAVLNVFVTSNREVSISSVALPALDDIQFLKATPGTFKESEGQWAALVRVEFLPLAEGTLELPSLSFPYKSKEGAAGTFQSPPVRISAVAALPPEAAAGDALRDIKPPVRLSLVWPWVAAALLLTAGIAGYRYWRKKKSEITDAAVPAEPPRPLDQVILEKLEAARVAYQADGQLKIFYASISDIFREYLGRRFSFDSLEKTTSEIYSAMKGSGAERKLCLEARDLLAQCDLVKFARYAPSEKEISTDFEKIQDFVRRTYAVG